jgi:hypothetical protein
MPKFQCRRPFVEAFRLGLRGHPTPAPKWFGSPDPARITEDGLLVPTTRGDHLAHWGDWIVRGPHGVVAVCPPEVFEAFYALIPQKG